MGIRELVASLRWTDAMPPAADSDWEALLSLADRTQLTLVFGERYRDVMSERARERIDRNLRGNLELHRRWREAYDGIASHLRSRGIEFLLLKGESHGAEYGDPGLRACYDIDLYCPEPYLLAGRDELLALGYKPVKWNSAVDHLACMVRETEWEWRGDYFDPGIPISIDLHFRFWDRETERIQAPGVEEFWPRRTGEALDPVDRIGYAALHALRHLLRGSLRPYHIYEIAHFLHGTADDEEFWTRWHELHSPEMRRLETICFHLARTWFACDSHRLASETLEPEVAAWFGQYAMAPLDALTRPNKHEIWLHLALLESGADKRAVFRRRLLPLNAPVRQAGHMASRAVWHARTLLPLLWHGLRKPFWTFLFAENFHDFGQYIFVILYNLYLLDLGYREDSLGWIAGAMTAGNIAGTLPAAAIMRRFGLRRTVMLASAVVILICTLRLLPSGRAGLMLLAFLGGAVMSVWAASLAPIIAALTTERNRSRGFSLWTGWGIGLGVLSGFVAGRLPQWIGRVSPLHGPVETKQAAILIGCALGLVALWPLSRLNLPPPDRSRGPLFPARPFMRRFLAALVLWNLAVGAFNPLFTAYFSRQQHMSTEQIGSIFSFSQLVQLAALAFAPALFRKLGMVDGIAVTQLGAAAALAVLAMSPPGFGAAAGYAAFTSFQYMSEPGMFTLLMDKAASHERAGASSLFLLVMFSSQAVAAPLAGIVVMRFGYPVLLAAAAAMALLAAVVFRALLAGARLSPSAQASAVDVPAA